MDSISELVLKKMQGRQLHELYDILESLPPGYRRQYVAEFSKREVVRSLAAYRATRELCRTGRRPLEFWKYVLGTRGRQVRFALEELRIARKHVQTSDRSAGLCVVPENSIKTPAR